MSNIASSALRAVTFRISSTPTKQLPHLIPWLVNTLLDSKGLLSSTGSGQARDSNDGVLVHKLKTQITTLLGDKSPEGRWAAVVLIKTTVDIGGWEVLQGSGAWVRTLLGILGKQDSSATKKLCIITLTRIFLCTHGYPTLIREITTPSLPGFLTACLNLVDSKPASTKVQLAKPKANLLPVVLESLCQLLPNHPTIFRSFELRLTDLLLPLLAPAEAFNKAHPVTASSQLSSPLTTDAAQRLYVLMHYCAPKQTSAEDWSKRINTTLGQCHATADVVLRAVIEDYQPVARSTPRTPSNVNFGAQAMEEASPALAFPPWHGIRAGSARLVGMLALVGSFIAARTASPVAFPVAEIVDLALRALSVTGSAAQGGQDNSTTTFNRQIGRDEREELWVELPNIHKAAIEVLGALFERLEDGSMAIVPVVVDQIAWIFKREAHSALVRVSAYRTVTKALMSAAAGFTRPQVVDLARMIRHACEDVMPEEQQQLTTENGATPVAPIKGAPRQKGSFNADTFLNIQTLAPLTTQRTHEPLYETAIGLLTAFLAQVPAQHVGQSLRTTIDRTAVLSGNANLMLASVLNPPHSAAHGKSRSSILPLLARAAPSSLAVEGLLRPRMPAIRVNHIKQGSENSEEEEDENEDEDEEQLNGNDDDAPKEDVEQPLALQESSDRSANPAQPLLTVASTQKGFSTTAEHPPSSNSNEVKAIMESLKRNVSKIDSVSPEAKRSRVQSEERPGFSLRMDSASRQLLEETAMPVQVVVEASSDRAEGTHTVTMPANEAVIATAESDDDGSDIEIPEINIDPDTEDEREDELA